MIQRKQSLWLFLIIICMVLCTQIPFSYNTHVNLIPPISTVTVPLKANYSIYIICTIALIIMLAGFAIFLFKKRKIQKILCLLGVLLCAGLSVYMAFIGNDVRNNTTLYFGIALPIFSLLLFILAWIGIRADERLLKSVDRLRD